MTHRILIIDDEPQVLQALERILRNEYEVLLAQSGAEGLKKLKKTSDIALILCDQRMPEMTGVETLQKSLSLAPQAIRILLTGYSDIESVIHAINKGKIYHYIAKPWETQELKLEIKRALDVYDLQKTIQEQNEKLKVLDHAKDQFLMLISHELKTPLTSILSYSESYLRGLAETKEDKERFVQRIHEGGIRLKKLMEETLDLVEAKAGKLKLIKSQIHFEKLIQTIISSLHEKASNKKITIENTIGGVKINGDEALLQKTFIKLLEFGIENASPKTHLWLTTQKDGRNIKITLAYRGELLTPLQKEKLFEPFLIVGDILTHKLGAGLGLPICKSIIEAHHGTIKIDSSENKETRFIVTLPP